MSEIIHQIGVKVAPKALYAAITKEEGLVNWWTRNTEAETRLGGIIKFRFGDLGTDVKIIELIPDQRVCWEVVDGMPEWIGTKISFDFKPEKEQTVLVFKHSNWKKSTDLLAFCNTKWATYLLSLKHYLETGEGHPHPDDIVISNEHCGKSEVLAN